MKITLIGLGICAGDLSLRARRALDGAQKIIARTNRTKSFKALNGLTVETLDGIFETCRNFDTLNKKLASAVLSAAKEQNVCYCVDGAVCEDEACKIILSKHKNVEVFESVSKSAHAYNAAKLKSADYVAVSAYSVKDLKSCRAAVVYDIDCDILAQGVKERLSFIFGEETECAFIRGNADPDAESAGETVKRIKIYEIDRQKNYDYTCAVAVEEAEFLKKDRFDYADLEQMLRLLRAPGGCPWDRVQTSESIKGNMIEEAYELVDAIERGDADGIEEETGDVLLQAAFHSVMAEERGDFTGGDALTRVVKKLIFRHSHIFGKDKAADDGEALGVWEKNKKKEKGQNTFSESVLAVPFNFPACMRAQKVQKRAAKSGMDFLSPVSASEKLGEEVGELLQACIDGDKDGIFEEAGDVLFSAVNTCRLAGVDCEQALRAATEKFVKRFVMCEKLVLADGKRMEDMNELELNVYWEKAKNELKAD
ncbi:MAG: nucleoside triphosphate pyrophosphohydrolase [Clostridia bacterium]|nr:nucleoside triphosphate pyrophosphohydrolase [Clostridia bacterium]